MPILEPKKLIKASKNDSQEGILSLKFIYTKSKKRMDINYPIA